MLRLVAAICNAALAKGADRLRQRVPLLALVETGLTALPQLWHFEPIEHEQRPFDPADFLKREVELVLPLVGRQLFQHRRWRNTAGFDRRDKPNDVAPVLADDIGPDPLANEGLDTIIGCRRRQRSKPACG